MSKKILFLTVFCLSFSFNSGFTQIIISGYIRDFQSEEHLLGAIVYDSISQNGVLSNEYGYYRVKVKKGHVALRISYVGYTPLSILHENIEKDSVLHLSLAPLSDLATFTITANRDNNIEKIQSGKVNIPIERLLNMPSIGGERDIIKSLSVLPGVSNGAEGTSTLLVRGGGQDQNQFVLDGANVYSTGHLLGFISTFNPDALKKVDFYKGGFPARFGGRLSSVVDVTFRDGNKKDIKANFDVGLINAKIAIEGPLKNNKTTYLLAARTTYLDFFQWLLGNSSKAVRKKKKDSFTGYTFFDLNAKITHEFNDKNKIFLSYYEGLDVLRLHSFYGVDLQQNSVNLTNRALSFRYFKIIKPNISTNIGVNYTQNGSSLNNYELMLANSYNNVNRLRETNGRRNNFLKDYTAFWRFDYTPNTHHFLRWGLEYTFHQYQANISSSDLHVIDRKIAKRDSLVYVSNTTFINPILRGFEATAYLEDEISFSKNHSLNIGLRTTSFTSSNKTYGNLEPRLAWRLTLENLFTINATYARTVQYSHALSVNDVGLERLVWVPSYSQLKPQKADLMSLGVVKSFAKGNYDISVETFYKKISNLSQFIFIDIDENIYQNWQRNILKDGKGKAYGFEFMANKKEGRLNGLVSYTLSWNNRQYEGFNNNKVFPFKYDRRHIFNTYASYQLNKKWKIGALWTYNTGFRQTVANGQLKDLPFFDDNKLLFNDVNSFKLPAYHRLDLNAINEKKLKNGHIRTWSINIYNAYARNNPIYLFVKKEYTFNKQSFPAELRGVVLTSILPTINYGLKF